MVLFSRRSRASLWGRWIFAGAMATVLAGVSWGALAQQEKTVTWTPLDFPPFFIAKGQHATKGIADEIVKVLTSKMPGYRFVSASSNLARFQEDLKAGKPYANPAILKTPEREQYMVFTVPVYLTPPNGITILKTRLKDFSADGKPLLLADLLKKEGIKIGIAKGRKYGKQIDDLLKAHEGKPQIEVRAGGDAYEGLFHMLLKGRIDCVLGFPHEAVFFEKEFNKSSLVSTIGLKENPDYLLSRVALPKTPWGEQVRNDMNAVLNKERATDAWRGIVERWLEPAQIPEYRKKYDEIFLKTE